MAQGWRSMAGVAVLLAGCSPDKPQAAAQPAEPLHVTLVEVEPAAGTGSLAVTGTVRLKRETALGFNTNGRLAELGVLEGQSVRPGQMMARLDPTGIDAASASARAEAVRAQADLQRLRKLAGEGWVTRPRVESAEATAAAAVARVNQTAFDVRFAHIVAPTAAVVLRRQAEPGQIIAAGQPVVTIGELASGFVLRVPLSDADLARVRVGQGASVVLPALGPQPVAATVSEIAARGDDRTGTFQVELRLPPATGMRSGLIGDAHIHVGGVTGAATMLAVPATAVFAARADEGFVYVYDPARRTVHARLVGIGGLSDSGITITHGLQPGERVVRSAPDQLRDGMPVTTGA